MTIQKFLHQITSILEKLKIPYAIAGGLAVSVWGRPRHTADVDIVVELDSVQSVKKLISEIKTALPNSYSDEDLAVDAFNRKSEFNIIESEWGLKADFFVSKQNEYQKSEIAGAQMREVSGELFRFISPEDLIISKLLWYRDSESTRQLEDIASVMDIQESLDFSYINDWVRKLELEKEWERLEKLNQKQ